MKKNVKKLTVILIIGLFMSILAACGGNGNTQKTASDSKKNNESSNSSNDAGNELEEVKARLAHTYPIEEPVSKGVQKFSELVAEKSGGKIEITIFPSGQLYDDKSMPEALSTGQIEMGMNTVEMWSGQIPAAEFTILPLFSDFDQVHNALDNGISEIFVEELNKLGVQPLIWSDFGFAYFASKEEPLVSPEDFEGKRVRVTSPLLAKYVELAGGSPVTMGGAEVDQALQRGTIDAALSGITAFVKMQYFQYTDYYSGPQNVGLVTTSANLNWWNGLSDEAKEIITEAAAEAQLWTSEEVEKQVEMDVETLSSEGMEMVETNKEDFKEIREQIIQEYLKRSGETGEKIVDIIKKSTQESQ